MSSPPVVGYSSWGRRPSISSQASHEAAHPVGSGAPRCPRNTGPDGKQLSSSVGSASHREPLRSFIHGSDREPLGKFLLLESIKANLSNFANQPPSTAHSRRAPFARTLPNWPLISSPTRKTGAASPSFAGDVLSRLKQHSQTTPYLPLSRAPRAAAGARLSP